MDQIKVGVQKDEGTFSSTEIEKKQNEAKQEYNKYKNNFPSKNFQFKFNNQHI